MITTVSKKYVYYEQYNQSRHYYYCYQISFLNSPSVIHSHSAFSVLHAFSLSISLQLKVNVILHFSLSLSHEERDGEEQDHDEDDEIIHMFRTRCAHHVSNLANSGLQHI